MKSFQHSLKLQAALVLFKNRKGFSFFSLSDYFLDDVDQLLSQMTQNYPGNEQTIEDYVKILEDIVENHTVPFKYWGLAEPSFA